MKLFVAGCSFSDYTKVAKVYGEYLAEKLNCPYIHEAAGCGSNYRIWRTIGKHVLSGELTSKDLLIVQYTTIERDEFWFNKDKTTPIEDSYEDGVVVRFKMGSHAWQSNSILSEFLKSYENHFVNSTLEKEKFIVYNTMFQTFLSYYKIKTLFVETLFVNNTLPVLPEFNKIQWNKNHSEPEIALFPWDKTHLSLKGHQILADDLYEHLLKVKIL